MFQLSRKKTMRCSFCNKSQDEVSRLIAGPKVLICEECVGICNQILDENRPFDLTADPTILGNNPDA